MLVEMPTRSPIVCSVGGMSVPAVAAPTARISAEASAAGISKRKATERTMLQLVERAGSVRCVVSASSGGNESSGVDQSQL